MPWKVDAGEELPKAALRMPCGSRQYVRATHSWRGWFVYAAAVHAWTRGGWHSGIAGAL